MDEVRRQLIPYDRNGQIIKWHDRKIPAGSAWRQQIDARLNNAQIILLFLSPRFIESDYCYEVEGEIALNRHHAGLSKVIPVILEPCAWEATPFGALQALPRDARPVSTWPNLNEGTLNVAYGVMAVVDEIIRLR